LFQAEADGKIENKIGKIGNLATTGGGFFKTYHQGWFLIRRSQVNFSICISNLAPVKSYKRR